MADYSSFVETAKRLLTSKGRKVALQQLGADTLDPAKPWNGTANQNIIMQYSDTICVFVPFIGKDLGVVVQDKELLKRSTQVVLAPPIAEGLEDSINQIRDVDGTLWKIVWAQCLKPADQTVIYLFGVAR